MADNSVTPSTDPQSSVQTPTVSEDAYSARMFNHQDQTWHDVPAHQVDQLANSGVYTFQQGQQLPVISPTGDAGSIPSEYAQDAWKQGYTWLTPQRQAAWIQQQQQDSRQRVSGDQPLTAAIAGGLRTATFGASSVLNNQLGLADQEKATAELNPTANTIGEIAGVAAPALLSGGAAGAAKLGLGTAAKGLATAGEAVEGANVASKIGSAVSKGVTTAIGESMPARVAASVAKNAVEGAVYGTGSAIGETAMGSPNDLFDNLSAHASTGALIGGSLGGVFGVASEAKPFVTKLLGDATDAGKSLIQGTAQKAVSLAGRVSGLSADEASQAGSGVRAFYDLMKKDGSVGSDVLSGASKDMANADALAQSTIDTAKSALKGQSAGAAEQLQNHLAQVNGDLQAAAQSAHAEVQAGQQTFQDVMLADKQPLTDTHTNQLSKFQSQADKLMSSPNRAVRSVGQDIDASLSQNVTTQGEAAQRFYSIMDAAKDAIKPSMVGEDAALISKIGKDAESAFMSHGNDATVQLYGALKDNQVAAQALGELAQNVTAKAMKVPTILAENGYQMANKFDAGAAATWFAKPENRQVANDTLSLLNGFKPQIDQISKGLKNIDDVTMVQNSLKAKMMDLKSGKFTGDGSQIYNTLKMSGVNSGTVDKLAQYQSVLADPSTGTMDKLLAARSLQGLPVSEDMKRLAEGQKTIDFLNNSKDRQTKTLDLGKAAAAVKTHGISLVAGSPIVKTTLGEQMGAMAKVMQKAEQGAKTMKTAVNYTADALTGSTAESVAKGVGVAKNDATTVTDLRKNYQNVANQLSAYQHKQSALNSVAPMAAQTIDQRHQQIVQYLQSKLPQDPLKETSVMFNKSSFVPSDQQLASFNRTVNAVNNPVHALADIANGGGSQESVDVLKTIYPNVLQQVHDAVLDNLIKDPKQLPYQQRLSLSSLFGVPTDYSLQPQVVQRMQQTFANAQQPQGRPQGSPSKSRTVKIDVQPLANMATDSQKTTYGLQD